MWFALSVAIWLASLRCLALLLCGGIEGDRWTRCLDWSAVIILRSSILFSAATSIFHHYGTGFGCIVGFCIVRNVQVEPMAVPRIVTLTAVCLWPSDLSHHLIHCISHFQFWASFKLDLNVDYFYTYSHVWLTISLLHFFLLKFSHYSNLHWSDKISLCVIHSIWNVLISNRKYDVPWNTCCERYYVQPLTGHTSPTL